MHATHPATYKYENHLGSKCCAPITAALTEPRLGCHTVQLPLPCCLIKCLQTTHAITILRHLYCVSSCFSIWISCETAPPAVALVRIVITYVMLCCALHTTQSPAGNIAFWKGASSTLKVASKGCEVVGLARAIQGFIGKYWAPYAVAPVSRAVHRPSMPCDSSWT